MWRVNDKIVYRNVREYTRPFVGMVDIGGTPHARFEGEFTGMSLKPDYFVLLADVKSSDLLKPGRVATFVRRQDQHGTIVELFDSSAAVLPDKYAHKEHAGPWTILVGFDQIVSTNLATSV